ncbi:ADP-forming succinate--CoA ligase subunit beta [bacterium]|nr:ADP-forming succinate--CoA ligase subunit beta [bacterium]
MKIHEYQAKSVFKRYGISIPRGDIATKPERAKEIAIELGSTVVVKAQIHAGGRGKGGGVKLAKNPDEAFDAASKIIGMNLVTHQTSPEGRKVKTVLVEEGMEILKEYYLAIVLDRKSSSPVMIASEAGGMEIEKVAAETPDKIHRVVINPNYGLQSFQARDLTKKLNITGKLLNQAAKLMVNLYNVFKDYSCSLAEINPLVVTGDGRVLALDAKLNFDDSAISLFPDILAFRDIDEEEPLEVEASKHSINYIKLDGNIGCLVNGAGLAMATMDIIKLAGGEPANFLDVGGGANVDQITNAFKILLSDKNVKAVLVNIFGGILRCDNLASGLVKGAAETGVTVPMVIRMKGTNVDKGVEILNNSNLKFAVAKTMMEAAEKVVTFTR